MTFEDFIRGFALILAIYLFIGFVIATTSLLAVLYQKRPNRSTITVLILLLMYFTTLTKWPSYAVDMSIAVTKDVLDTYPNHPLSNK